MAWMVVTDTLCQGRVPSWWITDDADQRVPQVFEHEHEACSEMLRDQQEAREEGSDACDEDFVVEVTWEGNKLVDAVDGRVYWEKSK